MGAWIEMSIIIGVERKKEGRTPRWVRGLKCYPLLLFSNRHCRTPRWVRGLKLENFVESGDNVPVAPHDGCVD